MKAVKVLFQSLILIAGVLALSGCNANEQKVIDAVREYDVTVGGIEPYKVKEIEQTLIDPRWGVVFDDKNNTYFVLLSGVYDNGDITDKDIQEVWFSVSSDFTEIRPGGSGDSKKDLVNTLILMRNWPGQIKAWKEAHK